MARQRTRELFDDGRQVNRQFTRSDPTNGGSRSPEETPQDDKIFNPPPPPPPDDSNPAIFGPVPTPDFGGGINVPPPPPDESNPAIFGTVQTPQLSGQSGMGSATQSGGSGSGSMQAQARRITRGKLASVNKPEWIKMGGIDGIS